MQNDLEFIIPEIRASSEVKFHHDVAPGLRFLAIDHSVTAKAPLYIAVRRVTNVSPEQPEYVDWHAHTADSLYLLLGDGEEMRGLHAVVRFQDQERKIESPMTVYIPRGVPHCYKLIGGSGTYLSILLDGDYNAATYQAAPAASGD